MSLLLILVPALPLALALLLVPRRTRAWVPSLAPLAPLTALVVSVLPAPDMIYLKEWLLGMQLGLDATGRVFLWFSGLAWLLAAIYGRFWLSADPRRLRFSGFFLLAMAGNLGLCVAQDVLGFYLLFAVMTFSAWGLILHRADPAAYRAGRIYLILAVFGEAALLLALWLIVANGANTLDQVPAVVADAPQRDFIIAMLLIGFGVKTGLLGLHVALPLAYDATPAPGTAVLASAMIKAGLLGWLRFLPLGEEALSGWATVMVIMGLTAAFYGVAVGLLQQAPRVILAYSSISQMGLIGVALGLGLAHPSAAGPALFAITLYALHHTLVKAALFLGEGLSRRTRHRGIFAGMVLLSLLLAGAPLTGGALAKYYLKDLAPFLPFPSPGLLATLLAVASVGTTVLMARFLWQLQLRSAPAVTPRIGLLLPWLLAVLGAVVLPWLLLPVQGDALLKPTSLWAAAWPLLTGVLLAVLASRLFRSLPMTIPPGDILVVFEILLVQGRRRSRVLVRRRVTPRWRRLRHHSHTTLLRLAEPDWLAHLETALRSWRRFGLLSLAIALGLVLLLAAA